MIDDRPAAKTVADCCTFRKTIGLEVTFEVLKDSLRQEMASISEAYHYVKSAV